MPTTTVRQRDYLEADTCNLYSGVDISDRISVNYFYRILLILLKGLKNFNKITNVFTIIFCCAVNENGLNVSYNGIFLNRRRRICLMD